MLKIRLQRVGRKHEPTFRLVLTDSKNSTKSGRFKEILGSYDPRKSSDSLVVERIKHWLSMGAHPTDTVHNLLLTHKVIEGSKKNVLPKKTVEKKEEPVVEDTPAPEASAAETPAEEASAEAPATPAEPAPVEESPVPEAAPEPAPTPEVETPTESDTIEKADSQ